MHLDTFLLMCNVNAQTKETIFHILKMGTRPSIYQPSSLSWRASLRRTIKSFFQFLQLVTPHTLNHYCYRCTFYLDDIYFLLHLSWATHQHLLSFDISAQRILCIHLHLQRTPHQFRSFFFLLSCPSHPANTHIKWAHPRIQSDNCQR